MSVSVGDQVQIKDGGIDVTNGVKAKAGKLYGEGGPLFGEVKLIVDNWNTEGKYGLPKSVTKVRIVDNKGTVVWQVRPEDVASNKIIEEPPAEPEPEPEPEPVVEEKEPEQLWHEAQTQVRYQSADVSISNAPYAMQYGSNDWDKGGSSVQDSAESGQIRTISLTSPPGSQFANVTAPKTSAGQVLNTSAEYNNDNIGKIYQIPTTKTIFPSMISDKSNRKELLKDNESLIQNASGYPQKVEPPSGLYAAKYDYSFIPGDTRYGSSTLEDDLMRFRAAAGIHVHGSQNLARSVKMYMYNRWKVPDTNMAQSKMFTHVFFTRPDLYLLDGQAPCAQVKNHTEAALIWRRNPKLLRLLTDRARCGDENNFNMLLSNQVQSFTLHDEKINTKDAGHSWTKQIMTYGDSYSGRGADTFDCTFLETNELSVISLIKLWMMYIDNVHTGAWSPNYTDGQCHVYDRALDYAASVYVFKCGPDGEDILYWSKYYGVFPITTGASSLSWENSDGGTKTISPTIEFAYSFKKDLSPVSLLEFNDNAAITGDQVYAPSYDYDINATNRPFVGTPYIEMKLGEDRSGTHIRLKFKKDTDPKHSDENLFRAL